MDSEGDGATGLFVPRPHVKEFLQFVSRMYTLAVWTFKEGTVIDSKLLLGHPLLFVGWGDVIPEPEDVVRYAGCQLSGLSCQNVIYLVSDQHNDVTNSIKVSVYGRRQGVRNRRKLVDYDLDDGPGSLRSVPRQEL